ncbi:hypothetical protein B0T21DRAFT_114987 [Apiosordaria backusii]|uniref:Uncharacterized protein n=1 Tax=Apiosordaria backusii TaxID=314023 RepID=A0AA39ZPS0_9PEZI|nr:hypothetical protein B0T21DRAFT_114987 [Apiosordaria backusii]
MTPPHQILSCGGRRFLKLSFAWRSLAAETGRCQMSGRRLEGAGTGTGIGRRQAILGASMKQDASGGKHAGHLSHGNVDVRAQKEKNVTLACHLGAIETKSGASTRTGDNSRDNYLGRVKLVAVIVPRRHSDYLIACLANALV